MGKRKRVKFEKKPEGLILNSLVDIALSLVIGFIVTIPLFFESGIFVNTPGVAKASAGDVSDIIICVRGTVPRIKPEQSAQDKHS